MGVKQVLVGLGLILTGLTIASLDLHPTLHSLQAYQSEIFYTNCLILFAPNFTVDTLPRVPPQCTTIEQLLPAGVVASGVVTLLFGFTKTTCFFSVLNLVIYIALYLNTNVDSSFGVYAHALEVLVCAVGLAKLCLRQAEPASARSGCEEGAPVRR